MKPCHTFTARSGCERRTKTSSLQPNASNANASNAKQCNCKGVGIVGGRLCMIGCAYRNDHTFRIDCGFILKASTRKSRLVDRCSFPSQLWCLVAAQTRPIDFCSKGWKAYFFFFSWLVSGIPCPSSKDKRRNTNKNFICVPLLGRQISGKNWPGEVLPAGWSERAHPRRTTLIKAHLSLILDASNIADDLS